MAKVAREYRDVFNNSDNVYEEEYRGRVIRIPPRGFVTLSRREAVEFLGQYVNFDREQSVGNKPLSWRPSKKAPTAENAPEDPLPFKSMADGKGFATQEELDTHLKAFESLRLKEEDD